MWWDNDTIDRTVTRQFVCDHLIPLEVERLDRSPHFGDGLTDRTYWEWINEKAKKIFLILVDLGVPDQIFGIIDDSWNDDDLPIALDQVERLALTARKDEKLERKFFSRQFCYLLRTLQKGDHILYEENEVVPLDVFDKKHTMSQGQHVDKVVLPNQPGMVFSRRRIPLGPGHLSHEDFASEVDSIKNMENEHLVSYWASYVHQGYGYILCTPAADFTLKSFISSTPSCVKDLAKTDCRVLVVNWIHCLVDTLSFIHNRGLSHGNIKPSTVFFTNNNHVFFSDLAHLHSEPGGGRGAWKLSGATNNEGKIPGDSSVMDKSSFDKESYDYAAPEQWFKPTSVSTSPVHSTTPYLNSQAADIFSLGCVMLDLLSFLLKKHGKPFAAHRAAKNKAPSRGSAVRDSSFHKNLSQVEDWMAQLAGEAAKKDEPLFRGILPMLHVVERMLAPRPSERPTANDVQARMYRILTESCGIAEPHCVHRYSGWDSGMGNLKLDSPALPGSDGQDAMSITARRDSCSRGSGHKRSSSGEGGASGSMRRTDFLVEEAERERGNRPRAMNGIPSGIHVVLERNKTRQWQAPFYGGHHGFRAL